MKMKKSGKLKVIVATPITKEQSDKKIDEINRIFEILKKGEVKI